MKINDSTGSGHGLKINPNNEAHVFAVIETELESANDKGLSYNLNSGEVTGLTSGDASLIYFKNDEDEVYIIDAVALGLRGFTGLTDMAVVEVIRNPTGGDLITDATPADMKSNANFGSSNTLEAGSFLYKGKDSGTITGGNQHALIYAGNNSRIYATLSIEVPRGGSVAVKITSDATAGTAYCALVGHLKDSNR